MSEEPLHVRVARALGWTEIAFEGGIMLPGYGWKGWPPGMLPIIGAKRPRADIPIYQQDWSATGPLLEKYGIAIARGHDRDGSVLWEAMIPPDGAYINEGTWDFYGDDVAVAKTPLVAVCNLILTLKTAGKL